MIRWTCAQKVAARCGCFHCSARARPIQAQGCLGGEIVNELSPASKRHQSPGEEIANSISHGLGLVVALVAAPVLILGAAQRGNVSNIIGAGVFALTLALLYFASTLYHALPQNKAKGLFQVLDHAAIYLLIAGTYTPFTLGVLRGAWGWTLLAIVWSLAIVGITLKAARCVRHPLISTCLYLGMGWVALIAIQTIWQRMPAGGILLLVAGGIAYTAGVGFFAAERMRYNHLVWHVFVLVGSICHIFAVHWYAA